MLARVQVRHPSQKDAAEGAVPELVPGAVGEEGLDTHLEVLRKVVPSRRLIPKTQSVIFLLVFCLLNLPFILSVPRQGPYLGFRSRSANGRVLQARRRGHCRLCFFSVRWGVWEQWKVLVQIWLTRPVKGNAIRFALSS